MELNLKEVLDERVITTALDVKDKEEALRKMDTIPVSINCWQLDDLTGFEDFDAALTSLWRIFICGKRRELPV